MHVIEPNLFDPPATSVILAPVEWIRTLLHGEVATAAAVVAIAALGLLMLSGRIPVRRALAAVLGCFIIFYFGPGYPSPEPENSDAANGQVSVDTGPFSAAEPAGEAVPVN